MTDRRRFLSLMGIGAASAPLAAKEVMDGRIADLAIRNHNVLTSGGISIDETKDAGRYEKGEAEKLRRAREYITSHGKLPDHVEEWLRDEAQHVSALDPDIACKRSWSMCVKINEQRQRNYQRAVAKYRYGNRYSEAQKAFRAITGFEWPW